jgi:hypothetical protein
MSGNFPLLAGVDRRHIWPAARRVLARSWPALRALWWLARMAYIAGFWAALYLAGVLLLIFMSTDTALMIYVRPVVAVARDVAGCVAFDLGRTCASVSLLIGMLPPVLRLPAEVLALSFPLYALARFVGSSRRTAS